MSAALLELRNVSKSFRSGGGLLRPPRVAKVVRDVSFAVNRGEVFGLVGESGSGKSTIGRMILRLIEADAGEILFDGQDVRGLGAADLRRLRRRVQMIFQDPFASLDPRVRVGDAIAAPIRLHGLRPAAGVKDRVVELLELVGLSSQHLDRHPHAFSGGQRQRVAIARALAVEPELIVCDEPVSALDLSVQAQVVNLLADLRARLGVSYVFISHDMAVVRHLASRVGVLYAGRLVETGPAGQVLGAPRHPYTRMLLEASPRPHAVAPRLRGAVAGEPPSPFAQSQGCAFASRCPHALDACRAAEPGLDAYVDGARRAACIRAAELGAWPGAAAADAGAPSPAYRARMDLLRRARAGERAP